jgi:hypothetical protein
MGVLVKRGFGGKQKKEPCEACLPQANNLSMAVFLDTGNGMSGSISILPVQVSSCS